MTIRHALHRLATTAVVAAAALLAGCASLNTVEASVASFGDWPAGTAPGTYAFDRLPSQQKDARRQQALEDAASQALVGAGFRPAADGGPPSVRVQIGARTERFEQAPWDDPFWWGGPRRFGYGGWIGAGPWGPWGPRGFHHGLWAPFPPEPDIYLHEVALLIRDTATGKALYETRATTDGYGSGGERLLAAMFDASMTDFPRSNDQPHSVRVALPPAPSAATVAPPAAAASGAGG